MLSKLKVDGLFMKKIYAIKFSKNDRISVSYKVSLITPLK